MQHKNYTEFNGYYQLVLVDLFKWYSTYVKSYNLLFEMNKLAEVSKEDKEAILSMIENLTDLDNADTAIDKLNSLLATQTNTVETEAEINTAKVKNVKAQEIKKLRWRKSGQ
ncbi:hypothetical protein [Ruminiclostridium cellulolyticum]|uniref:Uncharacterized protein n=1 Tax=Ruminiclostridium cellulolyticum (strain ATCC 35319 / DSM 5812 / JCM 6584 / H10) TaxID=394503 RepID=B8I8Y2_RUMCH|nr:hypothetical protein [Ruminiclostridium cellulolyticum]ACL77314.1 hypothetical protein Ccel_3022 [Ruminiclostridium cellulolyticum H10]